MSGTIDALSLIERTTASLCRALRASAGLIDQALSSQPAANPAVADAVQILVEQLQLRQAAWGPADGPIPVQRIAALTRGLSNDISVDLSALQSATTFPAAAGRIVLNILLLAADSLPQGGMIILAGATDDLFVKVAGTAAAWPIGMALCLVNEAEAQSALTDGRDLQMALTASLAHAAGIQLSAMFPPANQSEPAILRLGG